MSPLLEVKAISKSYSGLSVLKGINLELIEGEILALIGPNGAGKTTLFNIISGTLIPDSGDIFFEGESIKKMSPSERARDLRMGRTFQIVRPFYELNCLENVLIGLETQALIPSEKMESAMELLEKVGLRKKSNLTARELTIMEKKKLELARALSIAPRVLLLDEFMSGLNPVEVRESMELITTLNQDLKITIFWIEHLVKAVANVAHRIVVLNQGSILKCGNPIEVLSDPGVIDAYLGVDRDE